MRTSNILKAVLPHSAIEKHLPEKRGKHYRINQDFVLAIVAKLEPSYFKLLTDQAHDVRYKAENSAAKTEKLVMKKELYEALFARPFVSR